MNKLSSNLVTHIIFGLGTSGLSCARYFDRTAQPFFIIDTRAQPPGADQVDHLDFCQGTSFGDAAVELPSSCMQLIVSPGIALTSPLIEAAKRRGIEVVGDVELFVRNSSKKIIAITGSNGKSTVTELTERLLSRTELNVQKGGNIGLPVLDFLPQDEADVYVLELSSFQLDTTQSLQATIAVLLNISEDHMDRYLGFADYVASKQTIFNGCHLKVFNSDDPLTIPKNIAANDLSFSLAEPKNHAHRSSYLQKSGKHYQFIINGKPVGSTADLKITGLHNWLNALVSLSIVELLDVTINQEVLEALASYSGLAHRFEVVSKKRNCIWINDSKATNVGATLAALESLTPFTNSRVFLIAGGDSKNADLTPLAAPINSQVYCLVLLGKDAKRIAELSQKSNTIFVKDLQQAVVEISSQLKKGDLVLLSPACASLDMFTNFEQRGNAFVSAIEECA